MRRLRLFLLEFPVLVIIIVTSAGADIAGIEAIAIVEVAVAALPLLIAFKVAVVVIVVAIVIVVALLEIAVIVVIIIAVIEMHTVAASLVLQFAARYLVHFVLYHVIVHGFLVPVVA